MYVQAEAGSAGAFCAAHKQRKLIVEAAHLDQEPVVKVISVAARGAGRSSAVRFEARRSRALSNARRVCSLWARIAMMHACNCSGSPQRPCRCYNARPCATACMLPLHGSVPSQLLNTRNLTVTKDVCKKLAWARLGAN